MTSAITRAPAGAAHAHGFAKSLRGDAQAEGFEALFAAVAGAQPSPATPPVVADSGKGAEQKKAGEGANDDDGTSSAQLVAAMMTFVAPEVKVVDPRASPASANSLPITEKAPMGSLESRGQIEIGNTDSTPPRPAPASQTFVPNAAFAILEPPAHALIAHKGRTAESTVTPTADPPRSARAPVVAQTTPSPAPREPDAVGLPVENRVESKPLSTAPPSTSPHTSLERTRNELSPRALVQAAMVEVVRSPGRGRMPTPDAANNDTQEATPPPVQTDAAAPAPMPVASAASVASAQVPSPSIFEQVAIVESALPIANPSPAAPPNSTARAADIARQRQFVLGSNGDSLPAESDSPLTGGTAFETSIALHKADETLESRAPSASNTESASPAAPSGAWLGNVPGSSTSTLTAAAAVATPRAFDQAAWNAALAQQVTASAIAATRETTVRIKPDGLGPIEVRVRVDAQHVDVRFAIEHPVTVNMVREALPDLQRMLAQSGLNLGDAEVAQQNAGSRGQATRSDVSVSQSAEDGSADAIGGAVESRPRVRVGLLDDFV